MERKRKGKEVDAEKRRNGKGSKCGRSPLSGGRQGSGGMFIPQSAGSRATSGHSNCSETPRGPGRRALGDSESPGRPGPAGARCLRFVPREWQPDGGLPVPEGRRHPGKNRISMPVRSVGQLVGTTNPDF